MKNQSGSIQSEQNDMPTVLTNQLNNSCDSAELQMGLKHQSAVFMVDLTILGCPMAIL